MKEAPFMLRIMTFCCSLLASSKMEAVSHQGRAHLRFFSAMCTMEFAGLTKYQADANDEYRRVVS